MQKNQSYLKEWDVYEAERLKKRVKHPILMPMTIEMDAEGGFFPALMPIDEVKEAYKAFSRLDFQHWARWKLIYGDPKTIFSDYLSYFEGIKPEATSHGGGAMDAQSPLDLSCRYPAWLMFKLKNKNWSFSKDKQYSTENDADDMYRNFEKVALLDAQTLVLHNRCLSNQKGLKFNLHVTVSQVFESRAMQTQIIIDPDMTNDPPVPPLHD